MNWISVEERLPERGVWPAISMHPERNDQLDLNEANTDWVNITYFYDSEDNTWQHSSGAYDHAITHWLPLPEPPTE